MQALAMRHPVRPALSHRISPGTVQDMSGTHRSAVASPFKQPKAVFAVAFACVVSFMGIGLVDPLAVGEAPRPDVDVKIR